MVRPDGGWSLNISGTTAPLECDGLLLTLPAPAAAKLVEPVAGALSQELKQITYAGSAILLLGYARSQIANPLAGFGFVVPEVERRANFLAASFSSQKFPAAPGGPRVVARVCRRSDAPGDARLVGRGTEKDRRRRARAIHWCAWRAVLASRRSLGRPCRSITWATSNLWDASRSTCRGLHSNWRAMPIAASAFRLHSGAEQAAGRLLEKIVGPQA